MTQFLCKSCGFASTDQDARFCPNCGGQLEAITSGQAQTVAPAGAPNACSKCGFTGNVADAKFCHQCGATIRAAATVAVVTPASGTCPNCSFTNPAGAVFCQACGNALKVGSGAVQPVQGMAGSTSKQIVGGKLKSIPIARFGEKPGEIELRSDGLLFMQKRIPILSAHILDIAKAIEGSKSNLLDVEMKDGTMHSFKFVSARDWARLINSLIKK
jgi:predicted RNA-binding Zn-ribbon protein involved in translation (DUF1610 family)